MVAITIRSSGHFCCAKKPLSSSVRLNKMMGLTPIQENLLIFQSLVNYIEMALSTIPPHKDRLKDEPLKFILSNWLLLQISSFLDEWKKFEGLGKDNIPIQKIAQKTSPYLKRIRKWKGIYKFRSMVLAHSFRDENNNFISAPKVHLKHDVPTAYAEIFLLANCAINAMKVALNHSKDEFSIAVAKEKDSDIPVKVKGVTDLNKAKEEFIELKLEVEKIT